MKKKEECVKARDEMKRKREAQAEAKKASTLKIYKRKGQPFDSRDQGQSKGGVGD